MSVTKELQRLAEGTEPSSGESPLAEELRVQTANLQASGILDQVEALRRAGYEVSVHKATQFDGPTLEIAPPLEVFDTIIPGGSESGCSAPSGPGVCAHRYGVLVRTTTEGVDVVPFEEGVLFTEEQAVKYDLEAACRCERRTSTTATSHHDTKDGFEGLDKKVAERLKGYPWNPIGWKPE